MDQNLGFALPEPNEIDENEWELDNEHEPERNPSSSTAAPAPTATQAPFGRGSDSPDLPDAHEHAWDLEESSDSENELDVTVTEAYQDCEDPDYFESDDPANIPDLGDQPDAFAQENAAGDPEQDGAAAPERDDFAGVPEHVGIGEIPPMEKPGTHKPNEAVAASGLREPFSLPPNRAGL